MHAEDERVLYGLARHEEQREGDRCCCAAAAGIGHRIDTDAPDTAAPSVQMPLE